MAQENKTSIGILGYGEVGRAIAKFYKNPRIKDLKRRVSSRQMTKNYFKQNNL